MDNLPVNDDTICTYMFYNSETGESYIGSTNNKERRLTRHLDDLKRNKHHSWKFQRAFNKNPNFEVHCVPMETRDQATEFEKLLVEENWGNPNLLNVAQNVENALIGWNHTLEAIEKMKVSRTGMKQAPETVQKRIEKNTGQKRSEEAKARMSAAAKEQYANGRVPLTKGVKPSEEVIERMRQAQTLACGKSVSVNGIVYESVSAAGRALGIHHTTVLYRINSAGFPDWFYA